MNEQDILAGFPVAESWSLFAGEAGRYLIYGGIALFLISAIASLLEKRILRLSIVSTLGYAFGTATVFGAMAILITLFVKDQFQYSYVFARADVHTALKYKIAGVWSGQQGSFMLWACASGLFGLLALRSSSIGTGEYRRWYLLVFSLFLGTLCGILAYETPFNLIPDVVSNGKVHVPPTGQGLTPSLQNYWVVIHPPVIFLGFGALTVPFAFAMAAMLSGNLKDWVVAVRPWAHLGLALLGVGLVMGGLWAYETLGWGGFWAWDPVENTSFVPWIFLAAFVHGVIVQTTKKRWHGWNLWLGALPFLAFAYGTFLTRSGFLTEVSQHSFAQMEASALKILQVFLGVAFGSFILVYLVRGRKLAKMVSAPPTEGVDRETAYGYGSLLLSLLALVIALGMSWPLVQGLRGEKAAVVEEHLYHGVIIWFFIPIMLLMAVAPFISWRAMSGREMFNRFLNVFSLSAGLTGFAMLALNNSRWGVPLPPDPWVETLKLGFIPAFKIQLMPWIAFLLFLCMFVAVSSLWRIIELGRRAKTSLGGFVSHLGVAVLLAGLILSRGLESHQKGMMRPGEQLNLMGYTIAYNGFSSDSLRDRDNKVIFDVKTPSGESFEARPGLYYFRGNDGGDSEMVWPHIERYPTHDMYLTLYPPIVYLWKDPVWFKPGESKTQDGITVTYNKLVVHGEPGQAGTAFGADLTVTINGVDHAVEPQMVIGGNPTLPNIDENFKIVMEQMDAGDQSVGLQILFSTPLYPIELFYKPLTWLVWLGAGILFFGGLLSSYARRRPKRPLPLQGDASQTVEPSVERETENAPVPVA